jgi:lipid-A-disaccharide synthase
MVIVYKTNLLTYLVGKSLIKVQNLGMVNILLGKDTIPELIQSKVSEADIYKQCSRYLFDKSEYNGIRVKLNRLKEILGSGGASIKAASAVNKLINEH